MADEVTQRTIAKVSPGAFGHTHLEFTDGTKEVIQAGHHSQHAVNNDCFGLKPGDLWPTHVAEEQPAASADEYAPDPAGEAEEDLDDAQYEATETAAKPRKRKH